jgi:NAD(P)H-nitrite reductase large subunit
VDCLPATSPTPTRCDQDATKYKKAIVNGGGLPGLEAANGLMLRGIDASASRM